MKCQICNKEMRVVNNFHLDMHKISILDYKCMFPNVERYDPDVLDIIGKKSRENNVGKKRPQWIKDIMSKVRKEKIANGEIITPFMTMNKFGENNPAWGKHRSNEQIRELKEHNSKMMADAHERGLNYKYGKFYSNKNDKIFLFRSSYEEKMFDILEELECINNYEYETVRIPYLFEGIERHYIPDFLVEFIDGTKVIMEVGPRTFKLYPSNKTYAKFNAAELFCDKRNWKFSIVSEDSLDRLSNMDNSVNCWNDLKPFCHNVVGNDERDGLKSERISG
uniref:Putative endonuclease subunit n=1 Tax=viral metagenome TaxID=1070528 RepID=A0A6M3KEH5_9ZZZZ